MKFFHPLNETVKYPVRATTQSVGYDLIAIKEPEIKGFCLWYDTGIKLKDLPKGSFAMLVARSSISKTDLRIANSVGIIDPDYKDTIKVVFDYREDISFGDLQMYRKGDKIAQVVIMNFHTEEEDFAPKKTRTGGFGSTDKPKLTKKKSKKSTK